MKDSKAQKFMQDKLQKIQTELKAAVKMHSSQVDRLGKMLKD